MGITTAPRNFALFGIIAYCLSTHLSANQNRVEVNRIVAQVNDRFITWHDVERKLDARGLGSVFDENKRNEHARETIELMKRQIIASYAFDEKGFSIPDSYVEKEFLRRVDKAGGRVDFRKKELEAKGMTDFEYRQDLKDEIIYGHMRSKHNRSSLEVSPQMVRDYYAARIDEFRGDKQYAIREIVFSVKESEVDTQAKEKADGIKRRLNDNQPFEDLALAVGNSSYRSKGGAWPPLALREFPKSYQEVLATLAPGEVSEPFLYQQGAVREWCIIQLDKIIEPKLTSLEDARSDIENRIARDKEQAAVNKWFDTETKRAFVVSHGLPGK